MVFPRIHPAVSPFSCENVAKHLNISGNPLEPELLLVLGKPLTIGRVMTSLLVITFRIGQSVGKASTSVYDKDTMLPQRRLRKGEIQSCFANKGESHGCWFTIMV